MDKYEVKIRGVTPLLFNRFAEASISSKTKKRAGAVKDQDIEEKFYKDGRGRIYTPSTYLRGMLVEAGKNFKIQGKGKSTYSKIIGSSVNIHPDAIVHEKQKWDTFTISAVNPMTHGRMMVHRPKMDEWELVFEVMFNSEDIPVEVMKNILDYGGQYVGIGDWRPQKKGQFGKFIVTEFKSTEARK